MLPNIDTISPGVSSVMPVRRPEAEKAVEAYQASRAEKPEVDRVRAVEEKAAVDAYQPAAKSETGVYARGDKADINFHLSLEERDAFLTAFGSKQDPAAMTEQEQETLQKASERISKFIDEAIARNTDNRERVEKAVGEWYSRLTKGETEGPVDLVNLLRQAAMGNLDSLGN